MMFCRLSVSAGLLVLAGCTSLIPQSEPASALYRPGPLQAEHTLAASVSVREPEASRLLAGRSMAVEDASGAVRIMKTVQWTDRATSLMQEAVLDLLAGGGRTPGLPAQAGALTDYELSWRITDLSLSGARARCRLDLVLIPADPADGFHQTTIAHTALADGPGEQARALALVEAVRGCARQAADFVAASAAAD